MPMKLYGHPFSSYCQKVFVALYENELEFELRVLGPEEPQNAEELASLWPVAKMPVLVDDGRTIVESSIIIEYLGMRHPGPVRLIPEDPDAALAVRMLDRFFDQYVHSPMQRIVADSLRPVETRDAHGVLEARSQLEVAYRWLEGKLAGREWAAGDSFSLADCAAAPALFYADWAHPIDSGFRNLHAYRRRLLARPSYARAVDDARPYRPFFPLGAPDRD